MENISDCYVRKYGSIVATITPHQALSPGMAQHVILPYITYKDGLFQLW